MQTALAAPEKLIESLGFLPQVIRVKFKSIYFWLLVLQIIPSLSFADLTATKLDTARSQNASNYDAGAKAFTQSIAFSLLQTESRVKIQGWGKIGFEGGLHAVQVDAYNLAPFTDSNHAPQSFQSIFARGTIGLPLGFSTHFGINQVVTEHLLTGVNLGFAYQVLDFSTWIHTDIVPAATMTLTGTRTLFGPSEYALTGQANIGVYHRDHMAQFAYSYRFTYSILTATVESIGREFSQHGIISHVPLTSKWFLTTEVFFPTVMGTVSTGYQF